MLGVILAAAGTATLSCGLPLGLLYATPIARRVDERSVFDPITRRLLLTMSTLLVWILIVFVGTHLHKPWALHGALLGGLPLVAFSVGWVLAWFTHFLRNL